MTRIEDMGLLLVLHEGRRTGLIAQTRVFQGSPLMATLEETGKVSQRPDLSLALQKLARKQNQCQG